MWLPNAFVATENGRRIAARPFRGAVDVPRRPPPGTIRILCLGGSVTEGWPLTPDVAYPRRLQEALAARVREPARIEVLNGGYAGSNSSLGLFFFESIARAYAPDVVTVHYGVNDFAPSLSFGQFVSDRRYVEMHRRAEASPALRAARRIAGRCRLHEAIRRGLFSLGRRLSRAQETGGIRRGIFPSRVPPADTERNLRGFLEAGQADGFETVFVFEATVDTDYQSIRDSFFGPYWDVFRKVARGSRAVLLTPDRVLDRQSEPRRTFFLDGCHMTPEGLRLFAGRMADELIRDGVVERAAARARARDAR